MKTLLTILLTTFGLNSFGQLMFYSCGHVLPCDTSDHFTVDTLKISSDTTFTLAKHFIGGHLLHQEEQIYLNAKATVSHGDASNIHAYITFWHGHSIQWYPSGQKKCEGTFKMGKKLNDWKYWNAEGKEVSAPKDADIRVRGSRSRKKK